MIVRDLTVRSVRIPLQRPKGISKKQILFRDYIIVKLVTKSGVEGWSYTWGFPGTHRVIEELRETVVGSSIYNITGSWQRMFASIDRWGRGGVGMAAIAAIDNALWDALGKAANKPIYQLFGACRKDVPVYYSGGYYPADCKTKEEMLSFLEEEMGMAFEKGFRSFKMKFGAPDQALDLERIKLVRKTIGSNCTLMLDANCAYRPADIIRFASKFECCDIAWLEEPVAVDDLAGCAHVASRVSMPIASGENHFTHWAVRSIIDSKAASIIQPDPVVAGGLSQYKRIAGTVSFFGLQLAPRGFHDFNIQAALVFPEIEALEYMDLHSDIFPTQRLFHNPIVAANGLITPYEYPGNGLLLNEDAVVFYQI